MLFNRRWLIGFLAVALLIRSAAGLSMQIDLVYGMIQTHATATTPSEPCHETMQAMDANPPIAAPGNSETNASHSSACALCCIAVALPSVVAFKFLPNRYPAPIAVLFNSLPAAEQRPTKPPLV